MDHLDESEDYRQRSAEVLSRLDYITSDDYFTRMNEKADAIELRLNSNEVTAQEKNRLVRELDAEWIYQDKKIASWGTLLTPTGQYASGVVDYVSERLEGEPLISNGYHVFPFATSYDDEVIIQYKIVYGFKTNNGLAGILRERFDGEFPDSTPDMARRRLEYHYPDEAMQVAELAKECDEQISPVMNFKNYAIDLFTYAKDHNEHINDMQTYLYESMRFDQQLPYHIVCELDEYDDGSDPSINHLIARPERIRLLPVGEDAYGIARRHEPYLDLSVYAADSRKPNENFTIPLSGLLRFDSIRHAVDGYDGKDEHDNV
jgi:hypothetical protein